jgi:hypothetical protein
MERVNIQKKGGGYGGRVCKHKHELFGFKIGRVVERMRLIKTINSLLKIK